MGADLYVRDMPREAQHTGFVPSPEVGYFRDCYNEHGLFAWLTRITGETHSWWQLDRQHPEWFYGDDAPEDDQGLMRPESVKEFAAFVRRAEPRVRETNDAEYMAWYAKLLRFCDVAIEHNSPVIWSV